MAAQGEQGQGGICFDVESMARDRSFLLPIRKMAAQGEQGQGGICFNVESMARDGSYYYNPTTNCSQWEQPVQELYRQPKTESQNGGAAAPQRGRTSARH